MNAGDVTNIPTKTSPGSEWLQWYKNLLQEFSTVDANSLFLKAWHNRGIGTGNDTHELRTYLSQHGINIDTGLLSSAYDTAASVGNDITGAIGSVIGMGKKVVYILLGGAVLTVVIIVYVAVKHPKATTDIITTATKAALI